MKVVKFEKRVSFEEKLILENLFEEFVNSEMTEKVLLLLYILY